MSKLSCWYIEEAAEYETPNREKGPAYVFLFTYIDSKNEESAFAHFLSSKLLESAGSVCFSYIADSIREETGIVNITTEDVTKAFGGCLPITEYGADSAQE